MSSSLIKLIESSIFPAALLVVGKVIGLYLVIRLNGLEWQVNFVNNTIFSVFPVVFGKDLLIVSSYSDLIMLILVLSGFVFMVVRALYFHNTHIDPRTVVKLANLNFMGLIKGSFKIYTGASIWFIFSFLAEILTIVNMVMGKTYMWVAIFGAVVIIILTVVLIRDIEVEVRRHRKNLVF